MVDAVVIGGGFFGAVLAAHLGARGKVVLLERAGDLLTRASLHNQARIHFGYHYPRSQVTAVRSRVNAPRFIADYQECVVDGFEHYYGIARTFSKVTAGQFKSFCARIGAPLAPARPEVKKWFNPALVEDVVRVQEPAFDALALRERLRRDLARTGVDVRLRTEAIAVEARGEGQLALTLQGPEGASVVTAARVYNCTYARTNALLARSNLPLIPLKHEITEMLLLDVPDELRAAAVTVMCGPFFSCMPFPPEGRHSLSHVRYTPHRAWVEGTGQPYQDPDEVFAATARESSAPAMLRDAARYLPLLSRARLHGSMWEIKTVLPRSEMDDSRPILLRADHGLPGLHCIAGAKLDNVYDMLEAPGLDASPST